MFISKREFGHNSWSQVAQVHRMEEELQVTLEVGLHTFKALSRLVEAYCFLWNSPPGDKAAIGHLRPTLRDGWTSLTHCPPQFHPWERFWVPGLLWGTFFLFFFCYEVLFSFFFARPGTICVTICSTQVMSPPSRIFQCSNGHLICEQCKQRQEIRSCPTCR